MADSAASPWRPLRAPVFRNLLLANLVSDIGTFMQGVGAAWLMVSLGAGPLNVALIQTATALPFFLLVLPAGAMGDIVDHRRLILVTECWMLAAAVALAALTFLGLMTPWLLLTLTFVLSAGDACEAPTWRALLPELVDRENLAAGAALNGIEFNLARAVGPALAGLLVAAAGVGAAFAVNALSFLGVILVIARWKRNVRQNGSPRENLAGATTAALRYVRHSPAIRSLLIWTGCVMFFASALLALLPTVAHGLRGGSLGYGLLLGSFGFGAVLGAVAMPPLRAKLSTPALMSGALVVLSVLLFATGTLRSLWPLCAFMVFGGSAWMIFISTLNTMTQLLAPAWVRARVLATFLLVFQGSVTLGSFVWGWVGEHRGVALAFLIAGGGTAASILLRFFAPLPNTNVDLSPWVHWSAPTVVGGLDLDLDDGPVLVTIEYHVDPSRSAAFLVAVHRLGRLRRRDGAVDWGVFRDTALSDRYLETFLVSSWAEHLRQHERSVRDDFSVEEAVHRSARQPPLIRHFLYSRDRP
ncbi:MAG: MFS transporter [Thermoanaerobaculia bacterium]